MSWEKYISKLTSKTFLKADHFQINNEKNLTDQREKFVNYLRHLCSLDICFYLICILSKSCFRYLKFEQAWVFMGYDFLVKGKS